MIEQTLFEIQQIVNQAQSEARAGKNYAPLLPSIQSKISETNLPPQKQAEMFRRIEEELKSQRLQSGAKAESTNIAKFYWELVQGAI